LLPLAWWLASLFSQLGSMDRQSARLKTHRDRIRKQKRDPDDFTVS
jgi:hypothetical protein